jgi:hypothetical protein
MDLYDHRPLRLPAARRHARDALGHQMSQGYGVKGIADQAPRIWTLVIHRSLPRRATREPNGGLERETGFEPATSSLEGRYA